MTHAVITYIGGPLDGQERAVELPVPKHEYHEIVDDLKSLVQLRRYTLTEAGEYRYDLRVFGKRSPFCKTYPGGKTLADLKLKWDKVP